ncbi:CbbBc protein, partial [Leptospira borgpetersenii serovar Hardjo-bovis]|nr:CbbBc protein [Leptospira borgpetersenii serovar Hardjo-bovis]
SMVHASRGLLQPASPHLRSEPAIVAGLAKATLPETVVNWDKMIGCYGFIRDAIEAVFPAFMKFDECVKQPGGFRVRRETSERVWNTRSGTAQFKVVQGIN